jgi:hypothetical protein
MSFKPEHVRKVACELMCIDRGEMFSRERSPLYLITAREGIAGALRDVCRCTYPEMAHLLGKNEHSTGMDQYRRYEQRWPPGLRHIWTTAVRHRCEGRAQTATYDEIMGNLSQIRLLLEAAKAGE